MLSRPTRFAIALLVAGLLVVTAQAAEPSSTPDAAAALLSRFPAGRLPATEPVLDAIAQLETRGDSDHVALLRSLAREERGPVGPAAQRALDATRQRCRDTLRADFRGSVPDQASIDAWLRGQSKTLHRTDGTSLGPTERQMVAYTAVILGPSRTPLPLSAVTPADAQVLLEQGAALEDRADATGALTVYAQAAASGNAEARERILAFGVDPERLLLGLTASVRDASIPRLEPAALDALVGFGKEHTLKVLLERSRSSQPLDRAVALDALGALIREGALAPHTRAAALHAIDAATRDPRPAVRVAARTTLAEARIDPDEW